MSVEEVRTIRMLVSRRCRKSSHMTPPSVAASCHLAIAAFCIAAVTVSGRRAPQSAVAAEGGVARTMPFTVLVAHAGRRNAERRADAG